MEASIIIKLNIKIRNNCEAKVRNKCGILQNTTQKKTSNAYGKHTTNIPSTGFAHFCRMRNCFRNPYVRPHGNSQV